MMNVVYNIHGYICFFFYCELRMGFVFCWVLLGYIKGVIRYIKGDVFRYFGVVFCVRVSLNTVS